MVSLVGISVILVGVVIALWLVYSVVSTSKKIAEETKTHRLHEDRGAKIMRKLKRLGM